MRRTTLSYSIIAILFLGLNYSLAQQWNGDTGNSSSIYRSGKVGIGTSNPHNLLDIGTGFSFHSGGHKIIGIGWAASFGDLDPSGYASEIRFDPASGNLSFRISSSKTSDPVSGKGFVLNKDGKFSVGPGNSVGTLDVNVGGWGFIPKISFNQTGSNPSMRLYRPTGSANKFAFPWWIENTSQGRLEFRTGPSALTGSETVSTKMELHPSGALIVGKDLDDNIGRININTYSANSLLNIKSRGGSWISLQNDENDDVWHITSSSQQDRFIIGRTSSGVGNWKIFSIDNEGDVGIGTNNPIEKLHVENGKLLLRSTDNTNNATHPVGLKFSTDNSGRYSQILVRRGVDSDKIGLQFNTHYFGVKETMTLINNKVGIGTTLPDYKLDVAGTIRAEEIRVNLGEGADFVFENDYNLISIDELELFVKKNKHLPDFRPESEMINGDTDLGVLSIKLLQKIEELTLYTIELNKEIEIIKEKMYKSEANE